METRHTHATLVSAFGALVTSDVVTVATHSGCVPIFATEIAIDVVLSVVDVARAVVVFVDDVMI